MSAGSKSRNEKKAGWYPARSASEATMCATNADREASDGLAARNTMLWVIAILLTAQLQRLRWRGAPLPRRTPRGVSQSAREAFLALRLQQAPRPRQSC